MSELLRFFKDMRDNGYGLAEIAAQLGTSAIAEPVAGFAAMYDPAHGADAIREGMTYAPRTQAAQEYSQSIGNAANDAIKPAMPIIDAWKQGVDIAGRYSPVVGAALRTVPTAIGIAMGAKPALQAGRQVSKGLESMQGRMIANANAPRTLNAGYMGQRGAIGTETPKIKQISDNWESQGVRNSVSENGNRVMLSQVIVPKELRNQGIGSKYMRELIDYADSVGKRVELSPSADFGGNKNKLKEFYSRFGFVENKGRNKDFEISESMYRPSRPIAPQRPLTEFEQAIGLTNDFDNSDEIKIIADYLGQSPESMLVNRDLYTKKQGAINSLVSRYEQMDDFSGAYYPTSYGYISISPSAKSNGQWQLTSFDKKMNPLSDQGEMPKNKALTEFFKTIKPNKYGNSTPKKSQGNQ